jgi:hypothetical protein
VEERNKREYGVINTSSIVYNGGENGLVDVG